MYHIIAHDSDMLGGNDSIYKHRFPFYFYFFALENQNVWQVLFKLARTNSRTGEMKKCAHMQKKNNSTLFLTQGIAKPFFN